MKTILVICYVCVKFVLKDLSFEVTPNKRGQFVEAPEWIKDTTMFKLLLRDGSIKVAEQHISKKEGENEPMKDMSAEGKSDKVSEKREAEVDKIAGIPAEKESEAPVENAPAKEEKATTAAKKEKKPKETKTAKEADVK